MGREIEEKGLEHRLKEAGNKLLNDRPALVGDLLALLNCVESDLSRVDQAPIESICHALHPSMKALIGKELLRHSNTDVKVAVASCLSEITRITAPTAPYNDELMEEIFQIMVAAFENLYDMSNASYSKRVSVLKTMAKVRSFVMMLDLKCDSLILQMFNHFLKAIRESHPEIVFSSIEAIMTLIIEESEDISLDILSCLLTSVKRENEDILPISCKLGEKVIGNCAMKLKPYLIHVQSMGICLDEYSKIVTLICQETAGTRESNGLSCSHEHMVVKNKLPARAFSDVLPQGPSKMDLNATCPGEVEIVVDKSPIAGVNTDIACMVDNDSSAHRNSPKRKPVNSFRRSQLNVTIARSKSKIDHLGSSKSVRQGPILDQDVKKRRAQRTIFVRQSTEIDNLRMNGTIDVQMRKCKKDSNKEIANSLSEVPSITKLPVVSDEKKTEFSSPTGSHYETIDVPPSVSKNLHDASHLKRGNCRRKGGRQVSEAVISSSPSEGIVSCNRVDNEVPQSVGFKSENDSNVKIGLETNTPMCADKKVSAEKLNDETFPFANIDIKKEHVATSVSKNLYDASHLKRGHCRQKRARQVAEATISSSPSEGILLCNRLDNEVPQSVGFKSENDSNVKIGLETETPVCADKKASAEKLNDETLPFANIDIKKEHVATNDPEAKPLRRLRKNVIAANVTVESSVKQQGGKAKWKKRTTGIEKCVTREPNKRISETFHDAKDLGANIIGSRIKVWWPRDKEYYNGVVHSFDPIKKKHRIVYDDGDVENLLLENEEWEIDGIGLHGEQEAEFQSLEPSEMQQRKKVRKILDSSFNQAKVDVPLEHSAGNKSTGGATHSGREENSEPVDVLIENSCKFNVDNNRTVRMSLNNASSKVKDKISKTGDKVKDETLQDVIISIDDSPKFSRMSMDGNPKVADKLKGNTKKNGKKSDVDNIPAEGKLSLLNTNEDVDFGREVKEDKLQDCMLSIDDPPKCSKSRDVTPMSSSKVKGDAARRSSRKSNANGISAKGKSSSLKAKEKEDSAKRKLNSVKALEGKLKSGKKWRKLS